MYIKIFESRSTSRSYTIMFPVSSDYDHLKPYIENEKKERLPVHEGDLFYLVDGYFKGKQNEKV